MIWQPKPGQWARVHYRKSAAESMPWHGVVVKVINGSKGPGPRNVLCQFYINGEFNLPYWGFDCKVVVPRGNLVAVNGPMPT